MPEKHYLCINQKIFYATVECVNRSIRMDAYSAILNGEAIAGVHYKYDRQMEAYVARHNWD